MTDKINVDYSKRVIEDILSRLRNKDRSGPKIRFVNKKPTIVNKERDKKVDDITNFSCPDCEGGYYMKKKEENNQIIKWIDICETCKGTGYLDWIENARGGRQ